LQSYFSLFVNNDSELSEQVVKHGVIKRGTNENMPCRNTDNVLSQHLINKNI